MSSKSGLEYDSDLSPTQHWHIPTDTTQTFLPREKERLSVCKVIQKRFLACLYIRKINLNDGLQEALYFNILAADDATANKSYSGNFFLTNLNF